MVYEPPIDKHKKPYYVPIVTKNRDTLIGHIYGIEQAKEIMTDVLASVKLTIDLKSMDAVLDSTRFNDILENGKRESNMTTKEKQEYFYDAVREVTDKIIDEHHGNNLKNDNVLEVDCSCDIGYYSWKSYNDIPEETFKCTNCGKVLIDYTGVYDHDIVYDYNEG